jgi:hypothetical protein
MQGETEFQYYQLFRSTAPDEMGMVTLQSDWLMPERH